MLKKYIELYRIQLKNNWVRQAVYRSNFLTQLFVDCIWIFVEATLFTVIYSHAPNLAGWTIHQVYFFLGVFFASDAMFTIFFATNFWHFTDMVNKGELDVFLTKPASPIFLILTRFINLTSLFNFFLGIAVIIRFSKQAGFDGGWDWLVLLFWIFVGMIAQLLIRFFSVVWCFWTERGWAFSRLYYEFFQVGTKPHTLYPKMIRYSILTLLPFAFIGSIPAKAVLQGLDAWEYLWVATALSLFIFFNQYFWKKGLLRYQSASS